MWANLWTARKCEMMWIHRRNSSESRSSAVICGGRETESSVCLSKISKFSTNPVQNYSRLFRYWTQFAANIIEKKTTSVSQGASNTKCYFFCVETIEVGRGINFIRKHFSKIQTIRTSIHADTHTHTIFRTKHAKTLEVMSTPTQINLYSWKI